MSSMTTHEAATLLSVEDDDVVALAQQGLLLVTGEGELNRASVEALKSYGAAGVGRAVAKARLENDRALLERIAHYG